MFHRFFRLCDAYVCRESMPVPIQWLVVDFADVFYVVPYDQFEKFFKEVVSDASQADAQ